MDVPGPSTNSGADGRSKRLKAALFGELRSIILHHHESLAMSVGWCNSLHDNMERLAEDHVRRHDTHTLSALPIMCEGNPVVTSSFPRQSVSNAEFGVLLSLTLLTNRWVSGETRHLETRVFSEWCNLDGLVQDYCISSALAMEIPQLCTKALMW